MTIERKIVVGLDDIKAVSFECKKCDTRLTIIPGDIKEIPQRCPKPNCSSEWHISAGIIIEQKKTTVFEDLVLSLETIRTLMKNQSSPERGFRILFEFEHPES